jgi:hypothetical protein
MTPDAIHIQVVDRELDRQRIQPQAIAGDVLVELPASALAAAIQLDPPLAL